MLVVLLANIDVNAGLVNGAQGTIVGFSRFDQQDTNPDGEEPDLPTSDYLDTLLDFAGEYAAYREAQVKKFMRQAKDAEWPIVRFLNGKKAIIYADCPVNEYGSEEPYSLLSRTQIPLIAGWAMTIHKSQVRPLDPYSTFST